jgi:hypothetical protein
MAQAEITLERPRSRSAFAVWLKGRLEEARTRREERRAVLRMLEEREAARRTGVRI